MRLIDADKLRTVIHRAYSDDLEILDKIDDAETVPAITLEWIGEYLAWLKGIGAFAIPDANAIKSMQEKWEMEQGHSTCGPDYCDIGGEQHD